MFLYLVAVFCLSWFAEVWLRLALHLTETFKTAWSVAVLPLKAIKNACQTCKRCRAKCRAHCDEHGDAYAARFEQIMKWSSVD